MLSSIMLFPLVLVIRCVSKTPEWVLEELPVLICPAWEVEVEALEAPTPSVAAILQTLCLLLISRE
jgi:hypothetical protein